MRKRRKHGRSKAKKIAVSIFIIVAVIAGYSVFKNRTDEKPAIPQPSKTETKEETGQQIPGSFYLQNDPRWADDTVGGSEERFGDVGGTICCIAMALEYCGVDVDPGQLNSLMKDHNGYTHRGWVKWFTAAEATGNKVLIKMPKTPTTETIDETLELGYPVIAKAVTKWKSTPHWVLIVAKDGWDYLIKDPLGEGKKLEKLSSQGGQIKAIRIFKSKFSRTAPPLKPRTETPSPKPAPTVPQNTDDNHGDISKYRFPSRPSLRIQSKIGNGPWKSSAAIYPLQSESVTLKVTPITGGSIRWYQIIPDITQNYNNANWPWDPKPYQWKGFDKIAYEKRELTRLRGSWQIDPFTEPAAGHTAGITLADKITRSPFYKSDLGSFWFQAVVIKDGRVQRSAGLKDSDHQGISPKVFRVSVRETDGYIGYLTSFYNVPGIFGSVTRQSGNYIGVDCADVLMAAYGKWKKKPMPNNYNVSQLATTLTLIEECDIVDGKCSKRVSWSEVKPGDFIAVKYPSSRQYAHIGALHSDANNNGILDGQDKIIHAGPSPLHISKLKEGNFNGHIKIIRP